MQPQSTPNAQPTFPMQELEQLESAILASLQWIATLEGRRDALTAELDRITRPQPVIPKALMKTIGPGLEYRGTIFVHWNYIDIHIDLLRRLWTEFPDRREAMANAMGCYGTTRAYAAKTLADLFPGQSTAWAQRYSRPLVDDWYVDTNLNRERMCRILPAAVKAAGLKWGKDVKTYWRAAQIAG
ncbi:hypothetical protein PQR68_34530 [Paraburkholderia agricolaris]|uniref:hypothetical protein n=1 Tax=Paraburkholderia agricolaris TaxID=2152888 RepID=UPI0038B92B6E